MGSINTYEDIYAWQKAHELVLFTYKVTKDLSKEEKFNLIDQMRRAVVSVSSNIVEGFARKSVKESIRFYNVAQASLEELKYQYRICFDLEYIDENTIKDARQICNYTGAALYKWIQSQKENAGL